MTGTYLSAGSLSGTYATGNVKGLQYVGGLVGWQSILEVTDSYATGAVNGTNSVGGLVGLLGIGSVSDSFCSLTR